MKKITVLALVLFWLGMVSQAEAFRQSGGGYSGNPGGIPVPPPSAPPVIKPAKTAEQIAKEFQEKSGLSVVKQVENENAYWFWFGEGLNGMLVIFEDWREARKAHRGILEENKKGTWYSWSYSRARVLLVLPPEAGKGKAEEFEKIIYEIGD